MVRIVRSEHLSGHTFMRRWIPYPHNTFISANGAIEIRDLADQVLFRKRNGWKARMESLAAVKELQNEVRRRMVDVTFTIDPPASSTGSWWVDVQRYGRIASIEWRPGRGFGIASPNGGYGEGVDFIVDDASAAAEYVARVLQPFSAGARATPSEESDVLRKQLISALSAHIDQAVGEIVHTTVEKLLLELRKEVGDMSADVRRVEHALARIAERVLSEPREPKDS